MKHTGIFPINIFRRVSKKMFNFLIPIRSLPSSFYPNLKFTLTLEGVEKNLHLKKMMDMNRKIL